MKLSELLPRILESLARREMLETVADTTVWLITRYSCALGLALAAAWFSAQQRAASVRRTRHRPV
jgi:hypothetical protein